MLPRSLSSLASFPSLPSVPSLSSISSKLNIPSLPYTTSTPKNQVCTLDNSNTALVYNLSTKGLYLYTKTELDLMRVSKAVFCIPIPRFGKKVEVWLPESVDYDYDCCDGERVGEIVGESFGEGDKGERDRGEYGEWVYISEAPNDEWISREGNEQRCRVNEWGVREWWRGVVFLPAKVRIERLLGRWGVVFVVEE